MNLGSMQHGILRGNGILGDAELFGESLGSYQEALDEIAAAPEDYPDGTPIYIQDVEQWVVVYQEVPVFTTYDTPESYGGAIVDYGIPEGSTVWIDDIGDGSGGLYINEGNEPVPLGSLQNAPCNGQSATGDLVARSTPLENVGTDGGATADFDFSSLPDVPDIP